MSAKRENSRWQSKLLKNHRNYAARQATFASGDTRCSSLKKMANEQWQKVREIFDSALRRKPGERRKYVIETCGEDKTLLTEV